MFNNSNADHCLSLFVIPKHWQYCLLMLLTHSGIVDSISRHLGYYVNYDIIHGMYYLLCITVFIIYTLMLYNNIPYDLSSN